MTLNTLPMTTAGLFGPALGAAVVSRLGPVPSFAVTAAMQLIFVTLLVVVTYPKPAPRRKDADYPVRAAIAYVWRDRPLLMILFGVGAVGFSSDPSITLAPAMVEVLGGGTGSVGTALGVVRTRSSFLPWIARIDARPGALGDLGQCRPWMPAVVSAVSA